MKTAELSRFNQYHGLALSLLSAKANTGGKHEFEATRTFGDRADQGIFHLEDEDEAHPTL